MVKLLCIAVLGLVLGGCASPQFSFLKSAPQEPRKIADYRQTEKMTPLKIGVTPDGKDVIAYATERSYTASSSETKENATLGQKIGRFFSGLTITGLIFVLVSLLVFGGTPIVWLWAKFLKVRSALKKTIAGIEELNEADQTRVKEELKKTQDTPDKLYIATLKAEIKKEGIK